jgi:predicted ATPase
MGRDLPSGNVTLVFTDIEGSTKLLHELGAERYADALAEHRRILREAFVRNGGVEVDTQGDAFFYAFPSAQGAVDAAAEGRDALAAGPIHVRVGIHTGTPHVTGEGYVGPDVHKGARIGAAGHGGQILLSLEARNAVDALLTDLGEHRLKDFAEPVWIFQLGDQRFPPLKTISNTNLPHPASSFIGREAEVADVVKLVRGSRLVTLTGPGGSRKTRLAIEAAAELVSEHKNGVFWVGLATLREAADVPEEIAKTLGAKDGLADHIGEREILLLLDNLEQVIASGPALGRLLEACPNLRLLVTSRELLRIRGEVDYPVLPLAQPEAVALFCARARVEADDVVTELCRRLDNLPLAIELAAARANLLPPRMLLERLAGRLDLLKAGRDADPRQATLRATIEWSHDLLADHEKSLFARLGIFGGGCTLPDAEEVVDADIETMQSLLDKSLLRRTADRYWMLETIREFAVERLEASGEADELRRRHAQRYLALAEEAEPNLRIYSQEWVDRLEMEVDNLRGALDTFTSAGETQLALQLFGALSDFWYYGGHVSEGRRRGAVVLAADERATLVRARALIGAGEVATASWDHEADKRFTTEALAIYRSHGDARGIAVSLWTLGAAMINLGEAAAAQPLVEEAVERFERVGDLHFAIVATRTLAWSHEVQGDREECRRLHERNLARIKEAGFKEMEAHTVGVLASYEAERGKITEACSLLRRCLDISREVGEKGLLLTGLSRVANLLVAQNRYAGAATLLSAAEALRTEDRSVEGWVARMDGENVERVREGLDPEAFEGSWAAGRNLTLEAAFDLALASLRADPG